MREEAQLQRGALISKKIRVDALIGRGGMAEVYAAHHLMLDESVAVKILRRELLGQKEVTARFLREARASAKVRSEHAVVVYDVDEMEGGQPFIVMERLVGEDLAALLERGGRLPVAESIDLILQACRAVRVAHQQGIIHRDIKPGNLFLAQARTGRPLLKVVDFGISKALTRAPGDGPGSSVTQIGSLLGSPRYMAPEQMVDARSVDGRSDIWALACTAYRMITGVPPFDGISVPAICASVLSAAPVPADRVAPGIPAELAVVLARAMAKSRDDRYPDIDAFVAALEPFAKPPSHQPTRSPVASPPAPRPPPEIDDAPTAAASTTPVRTVADSTDVPSVPTVPIVPREPTHGATSSATVHPPAPSRTAERWLGATVVSPSHPDAPKDASLRLDATAEGSSLDRSHAASRSRLGALLVMCLVFAVLAGGGWTLLRRSATQGGLAVASARGDGEIQPPVLGPTSSPTTPPNVLADGPVLAPPSAQPASNTPPSDAASPSSSASASTTVAASTSVTAPPGLRSKPRRNDPAPAAPVPQAGVPDPFQGSQK